MKAVKVILISLFALLLLAIIAAIIIIKTIDINRFKPQIVEAASQGMGRPVDYDRASLGIGFGGISFRLGGLTVAEDPAFGGGQFVSVESISVGIDALGYLLRRQVSITDILIQSPNISIIRGKEGAINVQTIGPASSAAPSAVPAALPALFVSSIRGRNGSVTYVDRSFDPPVKLTLDNLDFTVDGLSLADPFPFAVQASLMSGQQNIRLEGKCAIDPKNGSARVFDLKARSDLSRLSLPQISRSFPMVSAPALPQELKGQIDVSLTELRAGSQGVTALDALAALTQGQVRYKEMGAPARDIAARVSAGIKDIALDGFSAAIGGGSIEGSGCLKNYQSGQDFDFRFRGQSLSIPDLYDMSALPVKAAGMITAEGQVKGHGFTPEALRNNMVGEAIAGVSQARLEGFNILRAVFDQLSVVPGISQALEEGLPEKYRQKLSQRDTEFKDFNVPVTVASGQINIKETSISSEDLFTLVIAGKAQFDGSFSAEGSISLAPELSRAMVSAVSPVEYLLDERGMVFIPLRISSDKGPSSFSLDTGYLTRKLVENQARQQILKGLDKLFGGQEEGREGAPRQQGQDPSETEKAVDKLLKGLFK